MRTVASDRKSPLAVAFPCLGIESVPSPVYTNYVQGTKREKSPNLSAHPFYAIAPVPSNAANPVLLTHLFKDAPGL